MMFKKLRMIGVMLFLIFDLGYRAKSRYDFRFSIEKLKTEN